MKVERAVFNNPAAESSPLAPSSSSLGRSRESVTTTNSGVLEEIKEGCEPKPPVVQVARGVIKTGTVYGGFVNLLKPNRSKMTSMFVVLSERAMEIYKSEKAYQERKPSKYTIDLAIAFNVHNEHYDMRLHKCVCVMRPDDTLVLKTDTDEENKEWFDAILGTAVPARALHLGRYASPLEFFEAAYDVNIVFAPKKLQQIKYDDKHEKIPDNILVRYPALEGARRLCFYANTLYICQKNIEPAKEGDLPPGGIPPFKSANYFEMQRKYVKNFGHRSNYFIMMMGSGSPTGNCELWVECEAKQVASRMHDLLNELIHRDVEKKKGISNGAPTMPESIPQIPRPHRSRANTQPRPHRPRLPSEIIARNTNSPLAGLARKQSTGTQACTTAAFRMPPIKLGDPSTSANTSLPMPGARHTFAAPGSLKEKLMPLVSVFPPARRQSETIKEEATNYQPMDPNDARKKEVEQIMRGEMKGAYRPISPSTTRSSTTDETEDSGGTLRCFGETEDSGGTLKMTTDSRPHSPGGIRNMSLTTTPMTQQQQPRPVQQVQQAPQPQLQQQPPGVPQPIKSKADHISSSEDDADADVISAGTNTSTGGESVSAGEDYAHMDAAAWNGEGSSLSVPNYKTNTPRSFVSSTDSCYSSMAEKHNNHPPHLHHHHRGPVLKEEPLPQFRTYSFGPGHPSFQRPEMGPTLGATGVSSAERMAASGAPGAASALSAEAQAAATAKEDARKRAFSLGSKNFFAYCSRPFRKVSARARGSATSTSGASLASSTISSGPPPSSSSSNHHIAMVPMMGGDRDDYRNRSGSFGSGRSTPYSRRSGAAAADEADHLMELDFGGGVGGAYVSATTTHHGLGGRCGSGSMGSVESPSRSRTSSFGCQIRKDDNVDPEHVGLTPSQILLQKAKQLSIDADAHDDSDYVLTEAPSMTSPRLNPPSTMMMGGNHHHYHQPSSHHSPEHGLPPPVVQQVYPGGVLDVMGKSHDARNSQYFETIEETTSGRSSRASSIDDGITTMAEVHAEVDEEAEEEDDYAMMDVQQLQQAAAAATPTAEVQQAAPVAAAAPQQQLQPDDKHASRSRSASPAAASARLRVDSSSSTTLHSLASLSSTRENKEAVAAPAAGAAGAEKQQQQTAARQKMSTQSDGAAAAAQLPPSATATTTPGSLPKRASVPVLRGGEEAAQAQQGDAAAGGGGPLNYAYLQPTAANGLPHDVTRARSKSGILFAAKEPATAAAPAAATDPAIAAPPMNNYAQLKAQP